MDPRSVDALREKQLLDGQVKNLIAEKERLVRALKDELEHHSVAEENQSVLQNEMRTLREQFETSFWESVDLEENITQIEQELDSTKSKLNLLAKARSATEELETDLNQLRESAKLKAAERLQLEKARAKLEEDLRQVKAQLRVETEARTLLSELLERKKSAMRTKLQSRTGIEELLMDLHSEFEALKKSVQQEQQSREALELQFETEVTEIHRRLILESTVNDTWSKHLEDAMRLKQSFAAEVEDLRNKMEKLSQGKNATASPRLPEDVVGMLDVMEGEIVGIQDLLDAGVPNVESFASQFTHMKERLTAEAKARAESDMRLKTMETRTATLEKQLEVERLARKRLEEKIEMLMTRK